MEVVLKIKQKFKIAKTMPSEHFGICISWAIVRFIVFDIHAMSQSSPLRPSASIILRKIKMEKNVQVLFSNLGALNCVEPWF